MRRQADRLIEKPKDIFENPKGFGIELSERGKSVTQRA